MENTHEHLIIACVGTNINHQSNIAKAREILDSTFADCRFSRVMLTLPIGMDNTNVRFNIGYRGNRQQAEANRKAMWRHTYGKKPRRSGYGH